MSVKRYDVNGSSSVFEDDNGSLVDYDDYLSLEVKLDGSLRYGRQADATIHNLELKLTDMAVQLANAESKCRELAWVVAENAALKAAAKEILAHWAAAEAGKMEMMMDKCMPALRDAYCKTQATDTFLAEVRAQGVKSLSNAVQSVISERQRQQSVEGWTPEHDDEHTEGEMAEAAACYAMFANNQGFSVPGLWPWAREWWKQSGQRRDLVKAGALILAEIERIDRQESAQ